MKSIEGGCLTRVSVSTLLRRFVDDPCAHGIHKVIYDTQYSVSQKLRPLYWWDQVDEREMDTSPWWSSRTRPRIHAARLDCASRWRYASSHDITCVPLRVRFFCSARMIGLNAFLLVTEQCAWHNDYHHDSYFVTIFDFGKACQKSISSVIHRYLAWTFQNKLQIAQYDSSHSATGGIIGYRVKVEIYMRFAYRIISRSLFPQPFPTQPPPQIVST